MQVGDDVDFEVDSLKFKSDYVDFIAVGALLMPSRSEEEGRAARVTRPRDR